MRSRPSARGPRSSYLTNSACVRAAGRARRFVFVPPNLDGFMTVHKIVGHEPDWLRRRFTFVSQNLLVCSNLFTALCILRDVSHDRQEFSRGSRPSARGPRSSHLANPARVKHTSTYTDTATHTYTHLHTPTHTYTHLHTPTHTSTRTWTPTHPHTYTPTHHTHSVRRELLDLCKLSSGRQPPRQ